MKKFLVIDDSQERQKDYDNVFSFVELDFAFSEKEFHEKIRNKYDGYFIDVIYENQQYGDCSFQQILEKVPDKKPLFIISEQWTKAMDGIKMRYLRESGKYNNVLGYLSWNIIHEGDKCDNVKDFVREQINNYYDVAFGAFDDDQSISILQISDIEFGNPGQEANIETARAMLKNKVRKLLRKLNINNDRVDFICICGDVAYKGEKAEYEQAKNWLKLLGEELLVNSNFENMLIVPGNHDYSFNSAAGNYYYYDKDKKEYVQRENEASSNYHEQAMYNFAKFVYELCGDKSYLLSPYKPIIKRTYESYGLNFILLNPIHVKFDKSFEYGLYDCDMEYLLKNAESIEKNESVCNIVLSHFASEKYSMIDPNADNTDKDIINIVNELNIKGWFYGHAHGKEIIDDKMIGNHKVLVSRTRSLMLNNGQHCEGEGNGFTVFKLYRENNQVRKISFIDKDIEKYIITP